MSRCARSAKVHRCRANCPPRKSNSCESLKCLWECSRGFRDARSSCVRTKESILTSTIKIMSMITITSTSRIHNVKLSLRDLDVRGRRVLMRVDFNVPVETRDGKIRVTDDTRIRESLASINYLREHGAKTILMSHFGRPKGKRVEKYSLRPIGEYLHSLIL